MTETRRAFDEQRWIAVVNQSGEAIPAFAAMLVTGMSADGAGFTVVKPIAASHDPALILANGPAIIHIGGTGVGTQHWPARMLCNTTGGTAYGTASGSWQLVSGNTGFIGVASDASVTTSQLFSRGCC